MQKSVARAFATGVSLVGLVLLGRLLLETASGALAQNLFPQADGSWLLTAGALLLKLPVPLHVISIGLILQRRWLSPLWRRLAWWAIAVSGCWLGAALAVRWWLLTN